MHAIVYAGNHNIYTLTYIACNILYASMHAVQVHIICLHGVEVYIICMCNIIYTLHHMHILHNIHMHILYNIYLDTQL